MIYSAEHKAGRLEVHFTWEDKSVNFPQSAVYKWTGEEGLPAFEQPVTAVRIIRYARRQLNWTPVKNMAPLIIKGYTLLQQMGYEPAPYPNPRRTKQ